MEINLIHGDCLEKLKEIPDESIDAIVTDPPYELGFMGKKWDASGIAYSAELWQECLRVLKPGAHLLAFGGDRTHHRLMTAVEDAGFEIKTTLAWIFSQGFPKSLNIHKQLQKQKHPDADKWKGFGTALKPAMELICLARKPLSEKTIAENCLRHGTGALDIDSCRIPTNSDTRRNAKGGDNGLQGTDTFKIRERKAEDQIDYGGRFPANIICSDDALNDGVMTKSGSGIKNPKGGVKSTFRASVQDEGYYSQGDSGSKSRYFDIDVWAEKYGLLQHPKASRRERNAGCDGLELKKSGGMNGTEDQTLLTGSGNIRNNLNHNHHPTIKSLAVMSWLVRLISKEGDTVLDPFMGSGTTGMACKKFNRNFIGIELNEEYIKIAEKRINRTQSVLKGMA